MTVLCAAFLLLLVYASLMPFDFTLAWPQASQNIRYAADGWPFGSSPFRGRADMLSNVFVYVPLGLLLAARLGHGGGRSRWMAVPGVALICAVTSLSVEFLQAFSPQRYASATDLLMNSLGGLIGAIPGALFGFGLWRRLVVAILDLHGRRPLLLAAVVMMVCLGVDALSPLWPTTDVGTVKYNLRHSHLTPVAGFRVHPWHHWLVNRVGVYAVLTLLLAGGLSGHWAGRWARAALLALLFAVLAEAGKPFIVSRQANVANVISSSAGVAAGLLCGILFAGTFRARTTAWIAVILLMVYMMYGAWKPLVFEFSVERLRAGMPQGTQWLPFYHYAMSNPKQRPEAVRLFLRTLMLMGSMVYAALTAAGASTEKRGIGRWLKASAAGAAFLFVLEFMQVFVPSRVPSATDVFCGVLGALLGVWVYRRYPPRIGE